MKFIIGKSDGKSVSVDSMVLADTRGLICASSGLGKSWLLRLIAEAVASSVQTIIIDPEGEFSTLREKLDLLIVSENGDLRADIRSAGLLARKLAETGVSAVIDIYDLPGKEDPWIKRRMFVSQFVSELMNLPKKLYHPMLVMVDEAHQFAQEETTSDTYILNGVKVNPSILSRSAIRSLMSAGRKRGIGGILATQRISKIDKDAIADARNVFIGGTTLDIDQRRAGDILGMNKAEFTTLRDLEPGAFFSFGPAIEGKGIIQFTSGEVKTTHPKAGQRSSIVVPKASTQIATIAEQFGDLPAIVEEEAKTFETLKKENAELRKELRSRPTQAQTKVETKVERVEVPVISKDQMEAFVNAIQNLQEHADDIIEVGTDIKEFTVRAGELLTSIGRSVAKLQQAGAPAPRYEVKPGPAKRLQTNMPKGNYRTNGSAKETVQVEGVTAPQQRILDALAWIESIGLSNPKRNIIAFLAGQSPKSSGFTNNLGALRSAGLITYPSSDSLGFTEAGRKAANPQEAPITSEELHHAVLSKLPRPQAHILMELIEDYPEPINREELARRAGQSPTSSGYTNNLGALRSLGVIDYPNSSEAVALPVLFLE